MKRFVVNVQWNRFFKQCGFKGSFKHYFDTHEEALDYVSGMDCNLCYRIKDRETGRIIKEGHTELVADKYGF